MSGEWAELFPEGRTIYYEGGDPERFRQQIQAEFGLDPTGREWSEDYGWAFHCPAEYLDAIYGSGRFQMGS